MCVYLLRARPGEQIESPQIDVPRVWRVRRVTGDAFEPMIPRLKTGQEEAAIRVSIHGPRGWVYRIKPLSPGHFSRVETGSIDGII